MNLSVPNAPRFGHVKAGFCTGWHVNALILELHNLVYLRFFLEPKLSKTGLPAVEWEELVHLLGGGGPVRLVGWRDVWPPP